MEAIKIWVLCVFAAICYGIFNDQITARTAVEYFTVGHPTILPTRSPTLLGLVWGVLATWWVGAIGGIGLVLAARAGSRPKCTAREVVKPIGILLMGMGLTALVSGVIGYLAAELGWIWLVERLATRVPPEHHSRYLAVGWAHTAAYGAGILGGIIVCRWVWVYRRRMTGENASLASTVR